jgi:hypothetical protein
MRQVTFKHWLTEEEDAMSKWKGILLGYLNLDPVNGLSQTLDTMNKPNLKRRLQGLGEFTKLPMQVQQKVFAMIDGPQSGTVGDLIRAIASTPLIGEI